VEAPPQIQQVQQQVRFIDEEVVNYVTRFVPETRVRRYTVARKVPEMTTREERHRTLRPVWETQWQDSSYDIVRYVPETTETERRTIVARPVIETEEREVWHTVRRPVQQTVMQERQHTVNRPVTTFQTQVVDRGEYVDDINRVEGRTFNRLTWQRGGNFVDPATGHTRWYLPGLYWTPMQAEPRYQVNRVFRPNLVSEQVPVTTFVPETIIEHVPVTTTTFQEERVLQREPVQVQRVVHEEVVERVPVTTFRQVVERVERQTPVQVLRMVPEEIVRQIPVTTFRTVFEEREEEYQVSVPRQVPVTHTVRRAVPVDYVPAAPAHEAPKIAPPQPLTVPQTTFRQETVRRDVLPGPIVMTTESHTVYRPVVDEEAEEVLEPISKQHEPNVIDTKDI